MSGLLSGTAILSGRGILSGTRTLRGSGILLDNPPALDLDWSSGSLALSPGGLTPSFSRASTATRVNASGQLEAVAANAMALDYASASGGWAARFEAQATNLIQRSEAFGTSPWTTTGVTVTSDAGTPFPGFGSFLIREDSGATNHNLASEAINHNASTTYTLSIYARAAQRYLFLRSPNFINKGASFNLATGQVSATSADAAGVENLGNGWLRCWISYVATAGNGSVIVGLANAPVSTLTSYQGDGSSGLYLFGAQLEAGGLSSYIQTAGSAAVRAADALSVSSAPWFDAGGGTFMIQLGMRPGTLTVTNGQRKAFVAGTALNQISLIAAGYGTDVFPDGFIGNGSALPRQNAGTTATGVAEKLALSYSTTAAGMLARNGAVSAAIGNFGGVNPGTLAIGESLNGSIRRLRYWPRFMGGTELSALTV